MQIYALKIACEIKKQVLGNPPSSASFAENVRPKQQNDLFSTNPNVDRSIVNQTGAVHDVESYSVNSDFGVGVGKVLVTPTPQPWPIQNRTTYGSYRPHEEASLSKILQSQSRKIIRSSRSGFPREHPQKWQHSNCINPRPAGGADSALV